MLESLAEMVTHDWEDLGSIRELGENVHASYRREMEKTWGPDHLGTLPEDYAQHVILGVSFNPLFFYRPTLSLTRTDTVAHDPYSFSRGFASYDWQPTWSHGLSL